MRVLALDIGSSSVKAGVWKGRGFDARVRVAFKTEFDGVNVEVPAGRVLLAVQRALREVLRGEAKVEAVSFCCFSSAVVVTDCKGKVRAGAITHQDRRSAIEARSLCSHVGAPWLLKHTGNLPYPGGIGSSTLAWLNGNRGELFKGDYRVGQLSSLIAWMLTGEWVIDPSQATFLGLWDILQRQWSGRICDAVGVTTKSLPRVLFADEIVGRITKEAARATGLPAGTPVVGGFVDGSAAVIQTPMGVGQLAHNSGSTDVLAMCVDKPRPMEGVLTRPVGVGRVFPERWLAVRTIAAAGSALDWARRVMFSEMTDPHWQRTLRRCIDHSSSGDDLICALSFAGERASMKHSHGGMFGNITLAATREQMLAAVVRGLTLQSGQGYDVLSALHKPSRIIYEMGGASLLRRAMHRSWQGKHVFQKLKGDSLRGLVELGRKALE